MADILLINGPNLGTLGKRKPDIYGTTSLAEIVSVVKNEVSKMNWGIQFFQSNREGDLIDVLEKYCDTLGAIVNPGALMMNGWSLRDALEDYKHPWIEVHLSNIWARETFRHQSILSPLASGVICGLGAYGYTLATQALCRQINCAH